MPTSPTSPLLHCDHGLRRQAIVQSLLAEVFQGRLRAGQHLVTQELAQRFGVSHTPIREALIALEGIGIIDLLPNRGAVVRRVGTKDVREICQVRRVLESEATRSACGQIDPDELRALSAALHGLSNGSAPSGRELIQAASVVDNRLHDTIASSCGNTFLANELNRLKALFRAFRDASYTRDEACFVSGRLGDEVREHGAIVDALVAGDQRNASRAMGRHILSAVEHWSRTLPDVPENRERSS